MFYIKIYDIIIDVLFFCLFLVSERPASDVFTTYVQLKVYYLIENVSWNQKTKMFSKGFPCFYLGFWLSKFVDSFYNWENPNNHVNCDAIFQRINKLRKKVILVVIRINDNNDNNNDNSNNTNRL